MGERHLWTREGRCRGCSCTRTSKVAAESCARVWPIPSVLTMGPETETGEDSGLDEASSWQRTCSSWWASGLTAEDLCPAPTPRAP